MPKKLYLSPLFRWSASLLLLLITFTSSMQEAHAALPYCILWDGACWERIEYFPDYNVTMYVYACEGVSGVSYFGGNMMNLCN